MTEDARARAAQGRIATIAVAPPAAGAAPGARQRHGGASSPWDRFGWVMAVIWMVFLVYPLLALLQSTAARGWIITGWVALAAFAVIYVAGFLNGMRGAGGGLVSPPRPIQWAAFAALIVCAALAIPGAGASALSFVPFIMSFASYGLTRPAHWITLVAGVLVTTGVVVFVPGGRSYFSVLAIVVLLGIVNTVSTTLIIRSAAAERLSLDLATSEAREAVARDVHDLVGHSLTVVRMKAQLARRLMDTDPERAKAELADIEQLSAEAIAGVRSTVAGARAATLDEQLASCRDALESAGVTVRIAGDTTALSPAQALTASWILREATTNILRHARAGAVTVTLAPGSITIADDGAGFDPAGAGDGNGLRGMHERAGAAGATLRVDSAPGRGTEVAATW